MNYIVGSNSDRFFSAYYNNLKRAHTEHPTEYTWPESELPIVFERMRVALERGSANIHSHAIRWTCKEVGIKHTYKAIQAFLAG